VVDGDDTARFAFLKDTQGAPGRLRPALPCTALCLVLRLAAPSHALRGSSRPHRIQSTGSPTTPSREHPFTSRTRAAPGRLVGWEGCTAWTYSAASSTVRLDLHVSPRRGRGATAEAPAQQGARQQGASKDRASGGRGAFPAVWRGAFCRMHWERSACKPRLPRGSAAANHPAATGQGRPGLCGPRVAGEDRNPSPTATVRSCTSTLEASRRPG
jgi:hypothetical protein